MNQQRRFLSGAKHISWIVGLLFLTLTLVVPANAAPQPTTKQSTVAQVTPSARVGSRRIFAWAGPGRGFWALGFLNAADVVPVTGITADRQWWQVKTQFGVAYVWYLDVTAQNVESVGVVDPGPIGIITGGRVIIRGGPGIESQRVGSASRGMQFYIIGTRPDGLWIQIKYRFGTGWVSTALTSVPSALVPVTAGEARVIVNAGALNVRSGPGFIYKSLGIVVGGTTMKIIGKSNDGVWLQVVSPFGNGWVNANYAITRDYFGSVPVTEASAAGAATEAIFKSLGGTANVRSGPGITFDVVFKAFAGDKFTIIGQSRNGWWYIQSAAGKGWINKTLGQASGAVALVPIIQ